MNPALETLMWVFESEGGLTPAARVCFLGAEAHPALAGWPGLTGWQPLKPQADAWDHAGLARTDELPTMRWPMVLVLPGKSRDETLAAFAMARDRLEPGGRIVVAIANTAGAGRFEKEFARATGGVVSRQKHKCRVFHACDDGTWDEACFAAWRELTLPQSIAGTAFTTVAGVFSSHHVDPGSRLLADHLPAGLRGRAADLGAGWGFLSDALLSRCPGITTVDLFEADHRALGCARINLAGHARDCRFHWHDVTKGLNDVYDVIIMNPPFHSGQATDVGLGRAFIRTAAAALGRGGRLLMVANRQLPYESLLDEVGLVWRHAGGDATFKLLFADKR